MFDYGAPTGFRLAVRHPDRITAIISQNGNAYEEGLSDGWNPIRAYWQDPSAANRDGSARIPDAGDDDLAIHAWRRRHDLGLSRTVIRSTISISPVPARTRCSSICSATTKVTSRSTPNFQTYFRTHKPPLLAVWGKNDPFFLPPGAEAFKRDIPDAEVRFFETGHFALETHCDEIASGHPRLPVEVGIAARVTTPVER